jgi:hypothetical protein
MLIKCAFVGHKKLWIFRNLFLTGKKHYSWPLLPERLMSLPSLISSAYLFLFVRGYIEGSMKLKIYFHLVPKLRIHGATSPLIHLFYCVLPNWTQEKFIFSAGCSTFIYFDVQQITTPFIQTEYRSFSNMSTHMWKYIIKPSVLVPSPLIYFINHYSYLHLLTYAPTCLSINKSYKAMVHMSIRC